MSRVVQEFYCATSGGGCGGFIVFPLNIAIDGVVEVVCPKCNHKHQRKIKDGVLTDDGRYDSSVTQEVTPTLAAWSKEAKHPESRKRVATSNERKAVVIEDNPESRKRARDRDEARQFLDDREFEIHGGK